MSRRICSKTSGTGSTELNEIEMLRLTYKELQEMVTGRPVLREEEKGYDLYHTDFKSVIDNSICKGAAKSTIIREGITFLQIEITFLQDTIVEMMSSEPQVGFGFLLKGKSTAYLDEINGARSFMSLDYADRTAFIYANRSSHGQQEYWANHVQSSYYIHFSYASFLEMIGDAKEDLPHLLYETLTSDDGSYFHLQPMGQELMASCYQLQQNNFRGKSREFFLEAKVFELIAHLTEALLRSGIEKPHSSRSLTKWEEDCVDHCYRQMESSLSNPPSLIKLAKETGLSVYRLKNGLRARYGNTPFKLLTEMRMLKAKELLVSGECNISEVAHAVGYSSIGSFSNTFFERFGTRPSTYKRV
jgi:AraC-like DNA-binding protein